MISPATLSSHSNRSATHALGQDGDGLAAEQVGVVGAAAAVVAGRRPHRLLGRRVELPGHQPRHQAAERRPDLVGAGREPLALEHDDTGIDAGQFRGELEVVDRPVSATVGDGSLCQVMRNRLRGSRSHRPDALQLFLDVVRRSRLGFRIWANVGMRMLRSRARFAAESRVDSWMVRSIMRELLASSVERPGEGLDVGKDGDGRRACRGDGSHR